jgi:hypothetical protein
MRYLRSVLLVLLGIALGFPVGWCFRGRNFAAQEAVYHNLLEIEQAKRQWAAEADTNRPAERRP